MKKSASLMIFLGGILSLLNLGFGFLYLTLIYPKTKQSKGKLVKIISGPILQAVDSNTLAVIWSTNVNSTGEVQYGPDTEHMITAFESEDGLIKANTKLHKVLINANDMKEVVYRVSSTKINKIFNYNVDFGNTVKSPVISYLATNNDDEFSFYIMHDVHNNHRIYKEFLTDKKYEFLISNGDAIDAAESFDAIINDFLQPIGKYTNGKKLFYFVRGNHETRGEEARNLKDYLALPSNRYYYTFSAGPVFAIVLDSGEDKLDNHREYSGLVDFENYKKEQTEWLEGVLKSDEYKAAKYHVVFIHMPLNTYIDQLNSDYLKTYEAMWRKMLSDAGIDIAFSGHTHEVQFLEQDEYDATFPTVISGGEPCNEKDYLAVNVEVTEQQLIIYNVKIDGSKDEVLRIIPSN